MKLIKLVLILSAITIFFIACGQNESTNTNTNRADNSANNATSKTSETPDEFATGRKVYKDNCAKCHKDDGTGGEIDIEGEKFKADNLTTDKMKKMPDAKYIKYITNGIEGEGMPAFKDILSEDEMTDVVAFIRGEFQK